MRNVRAGRDVRIEHTVVVESSTPWIDAGTWPILAAVVDPDQVVTEDDEDNNGVAVILHRDR